MNPGWVIILQWVVIFANLGSIYMSRQTRKQYDELSLMNEKRVEDYKGLCDTITEDYTFHINRLVEEIKLLKTSEGLYDVRNDPEQYQTFLTLLREKK